MDEETFVKKICQEYLERNNCYLHSYLKQDEMFRKGDRYYYYNGYLVFRVNDEKEFFIGEYWADAAIKLVPLIQQKIVTIAYHAYQNSQKLILNSRVLKVNLFDYDMNRVVKTTHRCNVLTRLYIILCEKLGPDVARLLVEILYHQ